MKCCNTTVGRILLTNHTRYEKPRKKHFLPNKVEMYSPSNAVARNLGEAVPLDPPDHKKKNK